MKKILAILTVVIVILSISLGGLVLEHISKNKKENIKTIVYQTSDFKKYLNMTRGELNRRYKDSMEDVSKMVEQSHMMIDGLYIGELGATFFISELETSKPSSIYIEFVDPKKIKWEINGALPGEDFKEIQKKLGKTEINKTWIRTEDNVCYEIHYKIDGVLYTFIANNKEGKDSELYVEYGM